MSLVTTRASQLGTCTSCASTQIMAITMTLTDGSPVDFVSCHACEVKSWKQGGIELDVSTVLRKAKKHKPI